MSSWLRLLPTFSRRCLLHSQLRGTHSMILAVRGGYSSSSSAVLTTTFDQCRPKTTQTTPTQMSPPDNNNNDEGLILSSEWVVPNDDDPGTSSLSRSSSSRPAFMVVLHGLLGNKRNVRGFAQAASNALRMPALLMDLRGHGASQLTADASSDNTTQRSTLQDCVGDVHRTIQSIDSSSWIHQPDTEFVLVGHSLGGRISLLYSLTSTTTMMRRPDHVWLLDTVPGGINTGVGQVVAAARALQDEQQQQQSSTLTRKVLTEKIVNEYGLSLATAQWMATSWNPKERKFQFDLAVADDFVRDFDGVDFLSMIRQAREATEQQGQSQAPVAGLHMVRGSKNDHWKEATDVETLAWLETQGDDPQKYSFHTVNAGHWVHIEDQKGLLDAMESIHT